MGHVKVSTRERRVVLRVGSFEVLYTPLAAEQLATDLAKAAYQVRKSRFNPTDALIGAVNWMLRRE